MKLDTSHLLYNDNSTYLQIDTAESSEFYAVFITILANVEPLGSKAFLQGLYLIMELFHPVSQLPSTLEGDSLWLRSPNGEPFITVYEVVADVVQPKGYSM